MRSARKTIPSFSLYGEVNAAFAAMNAAHIEDIASRSRKYLWTIDAHRHQELSQCVIVMTGTVAVTLEEAQHKFRGPAAILVPAGTVHSFRFGTDTTGFVLTVNLMKLFLNVSASQQTAIDVLFALPRAFDLGCIPALTERIASLLECLLREYRRPERLSDAIASALAGAVLSTVTEACRATDAAPGHSGIYLSHLRSYRALIESSYSQHWSVWRYAKKLKLSETTLNRLCLQLTGHTALSLIHQRRTLEAQRRLIYSGATVSGIARELGFKDLAYFSRFFRRHSGMSPRQFRQRNGDGKVPRTS